MGRPKKVITGQVAKANANNDLEEIITGRKAGKFGKFKDRAGYQDFLNRSDHFSLCEELLRLGDIPSTERQTCIDRCLRKFDSAGKVRARQNPQLGRRAGPTIQEMIES